MNVIPAIDLQGGKCVRLYKGDFNQSTEYSDDPLAVARTFASMQTTDLHIVDLDGARSGAQANRDIIANIAAETELDIQLGGGVRHVETLEHWFADGVARCVVGSLAVTEPDTVKDWFVRFGADRIVLEVDGLLHIIPMSAVKRLDFSPAPPHLPDFVIRGASQR